MQRFQSESEFDFFCVLVAIAVVVLAELAWGLSGIVTTSSRWSMAESIGNRTCKCFAESATGKRPQEMLQ